MGLIEYFFIFTKHSYLQYNLVMKKINFTLFALFTASIIIAQSPQAFKYQAIARDEVGNVLSIWDIGLRVSIIQKGTDGQAVYVETHKVKSNVYGLINLVIGEGQTVSGNLASIKWGENKHYLKIETDLEGGTDYKEVGISQLYAVPYALYAEQAGNLSETENKKVTSTQNRPKIKPKSTRCTRDVIPNSKFPADTSSYLNVNVGNVGIGTTEPEEKLDVVGKIMASIGYNTNGDDGLSDTINLVSDIDFNSLKLKYRTFAFSGGILTYISDTSAWMDTVGGNIPETFECGDMLVDSWDGEQYATVLIGSQCWMAENLKATTYRNGTPITNVTDDELWEYQVSGAYVWYDNDITWKDKYGALYNWYTTIDANGLCPTGWHVPTHDEWTALTDFIGGTGSPHGNELKSCRQVNSPLGGACNTSEHPRWHEHHTEYGTDDYGFSGLPGGGRYYLGEFGGIGTHGYWWSSSESYSNNAWHRGLSAYDGGVGVFDFDDKRSGFSVRCLRDF